MSKKQNTSDGAGQFDVILTDIGTRKISVITVVRGATGLGLKGGKDLVEGAPGPVMQGIDKADAEKLAQELEAAGANAEIAAASAAVKKAPKKAPKNAAKKPDKKAPKKPAAKPAAKKPAADAAPVIADAPAKPATPDIPAAPAPGQAYKPAQDADAATSNDLVGALKQAHDISRFWPFVYPEEAYLQHYRTPGKLKEIGLKDLIVISVLAAYTFGISLAMFQFNATWGISFGFTVFMLFGFGAVVRWKEAMIFPEFWVPSAVIALIGLFTIWYFYSFLVMLYWTLAIPLLPGAYFFIFFICRGGGTKDGRFKTGYKDNVTPSTSGDDHNRMGLFFLITLIVLAVLFFFLDWAYPHLKGV